jgi:hypothetical protein
LAFLDSGVLCRDVDYYYEDDLWIVTHRERMDGLGMIEGALGVVVYTEPEGL